MSENYSKNFQAKELKVHSPKQFNKVKLLQILGLLSRKFNYKTLEFERSWSLRLLFYLSLIAKPLLVFDFFISYFFPRTSVVQLYIGSIFNYLPDHPKFFIGIAVSIEQVNYKLKFCNLLTRASTTQGILTGLLTCSYHLVFNSFNSRNDYRLFKFWMKLTLELPVKSDRDYRVAGLSQKENKKFWLSENHVNYVWYRVMNWYILFIGFIYSSMLFYVRWVHVQIQKQRILTIVL